MSCPTTSGLHVPVRARATYHPPALCGVRYTGEYRRNFPTARRIAASLTPDLLALRTRTLLVLVRLQHGVAQSTAMAAIGFARKGLA